MADRAAVDDVLRMTQDCFPSLGLTDADIVATWAGLRPLIAEEGKAPRDTSRHDEVWRSPEGLLTIVGGKLTTYRRMGERVLEHVGRELGRELGDGERTAVVPLPGAELGGRGLRGLPGGHRGRARRPRGVAGRRRAHHVALRCPGG